MKLPVLFIGLGLLASCSKSDMKPDAAASASRECRYSPAKKDTTEDVYIVGQTTDQVGYFKNSQFISLATGSNPLGADMAFSGSDIYVLGQINDSIGYWKNGQFNFLAIADSFCPYQLPLLDRCI